MDELQLLCRLHHKPWYQFQYSSFQIALAWSPYASMSIYLYHSLQGSRLKAHTYSKYQQYINTTDPELHGWRSHHQLAYEFLGELQHVHKTINKHTFPICG